MGVHMLIENENAIRALITALALAVVMVLQLAVSPAPAQAAKRGTCTYSMWTQGSTSNPSGPRDCAATYGGTKYAYAAMHYQSTSPSHLEVTRFDYTGNRNGVGGSSSTFPDWRHNETRVDGSLFWGQSGRRTTYWDDVQYLSSVTYPAQTGAGFYSQYYYYSNAWHSAFYRSSQTRYLT